MTRRTTQRHLPNRLVKAIRHIRKECFNLSNATGTQQTLLGMTTRNEQLHYIECAREQIDRDGAVVDLGCWMCSTALSLAAGCTSKAERPEVPPTTVYAIDRFIWEEWMDRFLSSVACDYLPGESFLPEARRRIRAFSTAVELVEADLTKYTWGGGPIKLLLVDAMKSPNLAHSIVDQFYPYLTEGALLIHQDFKHWYTPWIHILQYRLRNYCRFHHEVTEGSTVSFQVIKKMPPELLGSIADTCTAVEDEVADAFEYSMALVAEAQKSTVAAAHIMYFVHNRRQREAQEMLESYSALGLSATEDFAQAKRALEGMTG